VSVDGEAALKHQVRYRLVTEADVDVLESDELRRRLTALLHDESPLLAAARFDRILAELLDEVAGLGALEPLLADPGVTEVMVNGPGRLFIERKGRLERLPSTLDGPAIHRLIERVVAPLGLRVDRSSPLVDARLADGSRVHAVVAPLALDGPYLTIRRFSERRITFEDFGVFDDAEAFLRAGVAHGRNILVSGGTSTGKTTLLNALAEAIPPVERVVTIEETAELRFPHPHVVRLEARLPNAEGAGGVPVRDLVRTALRMRPDRIVVGEVRGGEALDLLQALNTGHDGSLASLHANSVESVPSRLQTLVLLAGVALPLDAVEAQMLAAVDLLVHVVRCDGIRQVDAIAELVAGADGRRVEVRTLFDRSPSGLLAVARPSRPARRGTGRAPRFGGSTT
jgi:pilus assembly protein CpaF